MDGEHRNHQADDPISDRINNIIEKIIKVYDVSGVNFSGDALRVLLGSGEPDKHYNSTKYGATQLLIDYPEMSNIIKYIFAVTDKLKFNSDQELFEKLYTYLEDGKKNLNSSKTGSRIWIENFLRINNDRIDVSGPVLFTGPVGSGKSTYFKCMLVCNHDIFYKYKTIPSRIEFKRLEQKVDLNKSEPEKYAEITRRYLVYCMARDAIYYNCVKSWCTGNDSHDQYSNFLSKLSLHIKKLRSNSSMQNEIFNSRIKIDESMDLLKSVIKNMREKKSSFNSLWKMKEDFISIILSYASESGYKHLLIFDGFDIISPNNFVIGAINESFYKAIMKLVYRKDPLEIKGIIMSEVVTKNIYIFRNNTFNIMKDDFDNAFGFKAVDIIEFGNPSFDTILSKRVNLLVDSLDIDEKYVEECKKGFWDAILSVNNKLRAMFCVDVSIDRAFNNNYRKCLEFIRIFMIYGFVEYLEDVGSAVISDDAKNAGVVSSSMVLRMLDYAHKRQYVIRKMIILGSSIIYHNRLVIRSVTSSRRGHLSDEGFFRRNDAYRGFVDNIFNYHIQSDSYGRSTCWESETLLNRTKTPAINIRLRIIQIISNGFDINASEDTYSSYTLDEIMQNLSQWFGHHSITEEEIKRCIASLLYSEFAIVTNIDNSIAVRVQPLGIFLVNQIIDSNNYIEQVCLRTMLPNDLARQMVRYDYDLVSRGVVKAHIDYIINTFIFLQYIRKAEDIEDRNSTSSGRVERDKIMKNWRISARITTNFGAALRLILGNEVKTGMVDAFLSELEAKLKTRIRGLNLKGVRGI